MEKIDYLVWRRDALDMDAHRAALLGDVAGAIVAAGAVQLTIAVGDTDDDVPRPPLLLGRGGELAATASVWLDSLDDRGPVETALRSGDVRIDGYLVTESVPQGRTDRDWPDGTPSPGITHLTWFPKPDRLTEEEFYRGWHEIHTPASARLHPLRWEYVRDAVARAVTPGSPEVAAIVFERFRTVEDYADPDRLYGSPEALDETMRDLPLYADFDSISSRPMHEVIIRSVRC